jgi:hypothetical protein
VLLHLVGARDNLGLLSPGSVIGPPPTAVNAGYAGKREPACWSRP